MLKIALLALPVSLVALTWTPAPGGSACETAPHELADRRWSSSDVEHVTFFAVLEGLYLDGVSNEAVDAILARDPEHGYPANFVWGCPICMPSYEAMRLYRARPQFETKKVGSDTFGGGLDPATLASLGSPDVATRQSALMQLVGRWVERRLGSMRLSESEHAWWQRQLAARREKGEAILAGLRDQGLGGSYAQMKSCPFCDGANKPFDAPFADEK